MNNSHPLPLCRTSLGVLVYCADVCALCRSCNTRTEGTDVHVINFNPAGTCITPATDPTGGELFLPDFEDEVAVIAPYTIRSAGLSCINGTTARMVMYSDGACTAGQEISGAVLDNAMETNVNDLYAGMYGTGVLTASVLRYEGLESMLVADSPICNPTVSFNCDVVRLEGSPPSARGLGW